MKYVASIADDLADLILLVRKKPRTTREIALLEDASLKGFERISRHLKALHAAGLFYIASWETHARPVYAWQPWPGVLIADAPKPSRRGR